MNEDVWIEQDGRRLKIAPGHDVVFTWVKKYPEDSAPRNLTFSQRNELGEAIAAIMRERDEAKSMHLLVCKGLEEIAEQYVAFKEEARATRDWIRNPNMDTANAWKAARDATDELLR